jgi:hypothetical protein
MFEELLLSLFCLLTAVLGLAIAVWEAVSGRVFDMDGLWLTLISLTLAAVFGGNLAWSFYTGEGQQMLRQLRKGPASKDASEKHSPTPP